MAASSTISLSAPAVKFVVPPTVTAPESLIPPAFAVAERFPPILDALKSISEVLTIVALPDDPEVLNAIFPATARVSKSISSSVADVVKDAFLPTVMVPLSVMLAPAVFVVTVRS